MSERRLGTLALAALTPVAFGTTYLLTTNFLPPGRPLLIALGRSLPTGLVLIIGTKLPPQRWWLRLVILSVLYCSAFFPLLFVAAYLLPGGVASVINSVGPVATTILSLFLLSMRIRAVQLVAGGLGIAGVTLLVLSSSARLNGWGILAMITCVLMLSTATVLTKRWGRPPGFSSVGFTGWVFLLGGITLLPFTLVFEGLPSQLSAREVGGFVYLAAISGILAYAVLFWSIDKLAPSAVMFLGLINPVVAAGLGWLVLDQRLNGWQLSGAALVLVAVVLGQAPSRRPTSPDQEPAQPARPAQP